MIDEDIEHENEQYVAELCKEFNLIYCEGDSVGGNKRQLDALNEVYKILSKRMPVGKIRWIVPDNRYFFTFKSWKSLQKENNI